MENRLKRLEEKRIYYENKKIAGENYFLDDKIYIIINGGSFYNE